MARPSRPGIIKSVINTVGFRRVTMSTASSPFRRFACNDNVRIRFQ